MEEQFFFTLEKTLKKYILGQKLHLLNEKKVVQKLYI